MITLDTKIKKEWIPEIIKYQEDLDSEARREYLNVMKNSEGLTLKELSYRIFKKIYPGKFPSREIEKVYLEDHIEIFDGNLVSHLNRKF